MAAPKKSRKKRLAALPLHKLPSHASIVEQAKSYAPACIRALADEVANAAGASRVNAARELLDRGYGKVGQPIEVTGPDGGPVSVEVGVSPAIAAALKTLQGMAEE
ncbi:hypothetical protein [uncultured Desulfovibrio sp.]|uniref:hypothetical protein n=1 Tax=uncultured Desulfovibrio sp. TaxID=167968 RepID=UPI0025F01EFA|nr:hypothetical protein [uncultured Desulfovibrio sp.]